MTPDGGTPAEATSHLYGDTDAMRWTDAFASLFKVTRRSDGQDMDTDGLMLGWFANAIETGRDAGAARATAAERQRWTRDVVVAAMAAKFGPHKAYNRATRTYEPDGNDAESTTMITFTAEDGGLAIRTLTYGEIADLLALGMLREEGKLPGTEA